MNAGGQRSAVAAVIISLDAVGPDPRRAVEMDGNETRAAVRVRDRDPRGQGNEDVAVPGHDHPVAVGLENALQALRDIEGLIFLADALARNAATIEPAMAGVDHDGS